MDRKRPYQKPHVTVYEAKEIVDLLGPAQAVGASSAVEAKPYAGGPAAAAGGSGGSLKGR